MSWASLQTQGSCEECTPTVSAVFGENEQDQCFFNFSTVQIAFRQIADPLRVERKGRSGKMRPIMLSGHERSLTQVVYSKDGDLLFSVSKDNLINAWWTQNGERLGTYDGHNGTVWTVDIDSSTQFLLSGSADNTMKLWRVQTGECLKTWEFPTAIKRVQFSEDDSRILAVTEQRMGYKGAIRIFDFKPEGDQPDEPSVTISAYQSRFTAAAWSYLDRFIVASHEDGSVSLFETDTGEEWDSRPRVHSDVITDLQMSSDRTYFITSSKDKSAKIISVDSLDILKTFATETPLNSATILPGKPYVILGGGQEAMAVTTTSARQGMFEVRVWHSIFEQELARIKGGFGPSNTLAAHPDGTGYALGAEDGYVRLHTFDDDFFRARPYGNLDADLEE